MLVAALVAIGTANRPLRNHEVNDELEAPSQDTKACAEAMGAKIENLRVAELVSASGRHWAIDPRPTTYKVHWGAAQKELVLEGYNITWGDVITLDIYKFERTRMKIVGLLREETEMLLPDGVKSPCELGYTSCKLKENHVKDVCDLHLETLKALVRATPLLEALGDTPACSELPFLGLSAAVQYIESRCFDVCMSSLVTSMRRSCDSVPPTAKEFFEYYKEHRGGCLKGVEGTGFLPFDTVELLYDFIMKEQCQKFSAKSPLWQPLDKAAGDLPRERGDPVCKLPEEEMQKLLAGQSGNVLKRFWNKFYLPKKTPRILR